MAWVKIDDQYYAHPKVIAAGPLGKTLFVDALCYANQYLTDGFIPRMVALQLAMPIAPFCAADEVIALLIGAKLWHDADGGYQIHDYLDYNPSRDSVLAQRQSAKERMQRARSVNNDRAPDVRANFARTSPEVQECSPNPVPDPVPVPNKDVTLAPDGASKRPELTSIDGGKKPKSPSEHERRFNRFWTAYPKKRSKQDAWKVWQRVKPDDDLTARIIDAVKALSETRDWQKENGQFIPYPATWLKAGGWEDEIAATPKPDDPNLTDAQRYAIAKLERMKTKEWMNSAEALRYNGFNGDEHYAEDLIVYGKIAAGEPVPTRGVA